MSLTHVLDHLLRPTSIAIVGASSDANKLGGRPLAQCLELGFTGRIFPVNPTAANIQGLRAYAGVDAIEQSIDCAVIAVPAAAAEAAIVACARKGAKVAVVFSSGFAEHDAAGAQNQARLTAAARAAGIRVLGPNSMGALSLASRFSATFTTVNRHFDGKGWPRLGRVTIVSQSGAVGTQLLVQLRERGVGIAHWVATGNQCDIDVADLLDWCADDPDTGTVALYLEGAADGARLMRALDKMRARGKPVVALKAGRSEAGARAVASHTASLAGADEIFDAAFAHCGAMRARSLEDLADRVAACAMGVRLPRAAVGLVTNSGGIGVLMADEAAALGVDLPELPEAARRKLKSLAPFAVPANPADTGAAGMSDIGLNMKFAEIMLADADCPGVIIFLAHLGLVPSLMEEIGRELFSLRERYPDRAIVAIINTTREWTHALWAKGVLAVEEPTRAVAAIETMARFAAPRAEPSPIDDKPISPIALPHPRDGALGEAAARRVIAEMGIRVVEDRLARAADEAVAWARAFGKPVALKIASPDIAHKSDIGGVALGVAGDDATREGFDRIIANARANAPGARVDGVIVSPMILGGIETIVGIKRDASFGPVVMFGMGGLFVEIHKDTRLAFAPFGPAAATRLIESIAGYPLLAGARGRPRADIAALARALSRLSAYAAHHANSFESIEINPLIVLPDGEGVIAVDALIVPRGEGA